MTGSGLSRFHFSNPFFFVAPSRSSFSTFFPVTTAVIDETAWDRSQSSRSIAKADQAWRVGITSSRLKLMCAGKVEM